MAEHFLTTLRFYCDHLGANEKGEEDITNHFYVDRKKHLA